MEKEKMKKSPLVVLIGGEKNKNGRETRLSSNMFRYSMTKTRWQAFIHLVSLHQENISTKIASSIGWNTLENVSVAPFIATYRNTWYCKIIFFFLNN